MERRKNLALGVKRRVFWMVACLMGGVTFGLARRGRLANLARVRLFRAWLVWAGLGLQILAFSRVGAGWPGWAQTTAHLGSYGFLALFGWVNRRAPGLRIFVIGMLANILVIAANGGYMPVSAQALRRAGLDGVAEQLLKVPTANNSTLMGPSTRLKWLGDVHAVPKGFPMANVFSVGDVLMGLALLLLISQGMVGKGWLGKRRQASRQT